MVFATPAHASRFAFLCPGISASLGSVLSAASPTKEGNLILGQSSRHFPKNGTRHIPRHAITREFLESINHNRPNLGRILPLPVAKSSTDIEGLIKD